MDSRTPVLVGAGTAAQRCDDPADALQATELMAQALRAAADDATAPGLLGRINQLRVTKGTWGYSDPARLVADAVGSVGARTLLADVGILQTGVLAGAAQAVAAGTADVVAVVGGEAKHRALRASIAGVPAPETDQQGAQPDEFVTPDGMIISRQEIDTGMVMATHHYAMLENARRHADGQSLDEHRREVAELWERFGQVAAQNPQAWFRRPPDAAAIASTRDGNRMLAWPYTKWHNSQWNVDQAAALIFCSAQTAQALGVPADRWVFPHAAAESNHMVPISQRPQLHRSPGFALAGDAVASHIGLALDEIPHVDLYSCFPIAVRTQALELGLDTHRQLTVTGGMTWAGGPLNNYVLQAAVKLAEVLRADPASRGLLTSVSGMLTKQGVSVWSAAPPPQPFANLDVTTAAQQRVPAMSCRLGVQGTASVVSYTVLWDRDGPQRAVVLAELPDGTRTLASCNHPEVMEAVTASEFCGQQVQVHDDATFIPAT